MAQTKNIKFDNSYVRLGSQFGRPQLPTRVKAPCLIRINEELADALDIDPGFLRGEQALQALAGNAVLPGSEPFAGVYAGHQFGGWNPQLGDGRAILLGEVIGRDGKRYDLQLKGSGETPYSRMGDGRSPLGPVLREYLVSEAMHRLGVATTRSLAAVTTGERVFRDRVLPGAILTRVASSHIRVGTFQYFSARGDLNSVKILADHAIERHYPDAADDDNPYLSLLRQTIARQARLIAHWQSFGFIHGVMNTDNMLICGETIDYGPCAFMDAYHPAKVFSSIDQHGRYAYQNQPAIGQWNLAWFAQTLMPLLDENEDTALKLAQDAVSDFKLIYDSSYRQRMAGKLGFASADDSSDELTQALFAIMADNKLDFTLTFRHLADRINPNSERDHRVDDLFHDSHFLEEWSKRWQMALSGPDFNAADCQAQMYRHNPALIARNHLVEEAINDATDQQDFTAFHRLAEVLETPFDYRSNLARLATPPTPEQEIKRTFCGT